MFDQPDEVLGRRLDSALQEGLGSDRVDVGALLVGARHRARTVRNRRIAAAVAAAAVVLGGPVGYEVLHPAAGAAAPPAAMIPGSSGRAAPNHPGPLPDRLALPADQLPAGLTLVASGSKAAPVGGPACLPAVTALPARPVGARRWAWSGAGDARGPGADQGLGVDLLVARWPSSRVRAAVAGLVASTDGCRWQQTDAAAATVDETWTSVSAAAGGAGASARVVVRRGDLVAAIQVRHPDGAPAALALAVRLARFEAARLR